MSEIKTPYEISIWTDETKQYTNTTTFYLDTDTGRSEEAILIDLNILEKPLIKSIDGPLTEQGTREYHGETFDHLKFKWDTLPFKKATNHSYYDTDDWIKTATIKYNDWHIKYSSKTYGKDVLTHITAIALRFPKIKVKYNLGKLGFTNETAKENFLNIVCGGQTDYLTKYADRDLYVVPEQFKNVLSFTNREQSRFHSMMLIGVPTSDTEEAVGCSKRNYIIKNWTPQYDEQESGLTIEGLKTLFQQSVFISEYVDIFSIKSGADGANVLDGDLYMAALLEKGSIKDSSQNYWYFPNYIWSYYGYWDGSKPFYKDLLPQIHIITNDGTKWREYTQWETSTDNIASGLFTPFLERNLNNYEYDYVNSHYQFPLIYNYDTLYKYNSSGEPSLDDLEVTSTICPQFEVADIDNFSGITIQLDIPVGCEVELDFGLMMRAAGKGYEEDSTSRTSILYSKYSTLINNFFNGKDYNSPIFDYLDEKKFLVIGSNEMTTKNKAISPIFSQSVAGISTLTFSMYTNYFDDTTQQFVDNPFVTYLNNETRVKLKKDDEWFDFVVKSKEEDSEQNMVTYTCKDYFASVLGKQGYNVTLSKDIYNSQGTIKEMTDTVLEGSDWRQDTSEGTGTETLVEKQEDTLYEVSFPVLTGGRYGNYSGKPYSYMGGTIQYSEEYQPYTETCYMRYSDIINILSKSNEEVEVPGYLKNDIWFTNPSYTGTILGYPSLPKDSNGVADDNEENLVKFRCDKDNLEKLQEDLSKRILTSYRAKKIVTSYITKYIPELDKYVQVYKKEDENGDWKEYYCYTKTEYVTNDMVTELLVNGGAETEDITGITSTEGWTTSNYSTMPIELSSEIKEVSDAGFPSAVVGSEDLSTAVQSYIHFPMVSPTQRVIFANLGPNSNIKSLTKGQRFILELEVEWDGTTSGPAKEDDLDLVLRQIEHAENGYTTIVDFARPAIIDGETRSRCLNFGTDCRYLFLFELEVIKTVTETELQDITLALTSRTYKWYCNKILRASLYREVFNNNDETDYIISPNYTLRLNPKDWEGISPSNGDTRDTYFYPTTETPTVEKRIWYNIYDPSLTTNENFESEKDLTFAYQGYASPESQNYVAETINEKIRELEISKSNYFNILQSLAEAFECWCKLRIDHEEDGRIKLSSVKDKYVQEKYVSFHQFIGQENPASLKYGINEKSVHRTVDSDSLVTKLIVEDNVNSYATNGFCSIARAQDNPTKDNVIYNLDYHIQMNLLSEEARNDLETYQMKLGQISSSLTKLTEESTSLSTSITKEEANLEVFSDLVDESQTTLIDLKNTFSLIYGVTTDALKKQTDWETFTNAKIYKADGYFVDGFREDFINILTLEADVETYTNQKKAATASLKTFKSQLTNVTTQLDSISEQRQYLTKQFTQKYNLFLQEGFWSSSDYLDDNKYYLDAHQVLAKANKPKVSYEISCIDVGSLEGYEPYAYKIGDRLQIEDTEFFGWTLLYDDNYKQYIRTPYKEDIIVSEILFNLDDASQTSITVQNYQDQFEDLFQKISSETQSLQFKEGSYDNAAGAVGSDGQILSDAITNTFNNASFVIKNAAEQSLVWDNSGLTTTDQSNKNLIVRIAGGVIKISKAGDGNWTTVLDGSGINADTITAGTLNANNVKIKSGDNDAFQWNSSGLNAYLFDNNTYYKNSQITFNQYGIYGDLADDISLSATYEEKLRAIRETSNFALTWLGFSLRTGHQNDTGYVSIDSENDFTVNVKASPTDEDYQKIIQIGHLEDSNASGSDANGETSESSEANAIDHYGIRVRDLSGNTIFETSETGDLNGRFYIDCGSW